MELQRCMCDAHGVWFCVSLVSAESRMRASIAVSSFDHSTPFKRPHSTISNSSSSSSSSQSSSSLLSSLNLHLHPSLSHWPYDCIEEDELEHDSTLQPSTSEWHWALEEWCWKFSFDHSNQLQFNTYSHNSYFIYIYILVLSIDSKKLTN